MTWLRVRIKWYAGLISADLPESMVGSWIAQAVEKIGPMPATELSITVEVAW